VSVYALDFRRLCALAGVFVTAEPWWKFPALPAASAVDDAQIIPSEHACWIEWLLRWGGFLPPPAPPEPSEQGE
jgi:hypothetical protein